MWVSSLSTLRKKARSGADDLWSPVGTSLLNDASDRFLLIPAENGIEDLKRDERFGKQLGACRIHLT